MKKIIFCGLAFVLSNGFAGPAPKVKLNKLMGSSEFCRSGRKFSWNDKAVVFTSPFLDDCDGISTRQFAGAKKGDVFIYEKNCVDRQGLAAIIAVDYKFTIDPAKRTIKFEYFDGAANDRPKRPLFSNPLVSRMTDAFTQTCSYY